MRIAALSDSTVPSGSTSVGIWPSGLSLSRSLNASLGSHDAVSIVLYGAPATSSATWVVADPDPFLPYSVYIAPPFLGAVTPVCRPPSSPPCASASPPPTHPPCAWQWSRCGRRDRQVSRCDRHRTDP